MYKQAELTIKGSLGDRQIQIRMMPWVQMIDPRQPDLEEEKKKQDKWNQEKEKIDLELKKLKYLIDNLPPILASLGFDTAAIRAEIAKIQARIENILDTWEAFTPLP